MKKNLLATLLLSSAMFVGLNRVNAEELQSSNFDLDQKNYSLKTADKYGVTSIPYFGNSLIIGERIYTLNSYFISAYEVKSAVDAYRTAHSGSLDTPLYYLAGNGTDINALYEITDGYDGEGQLKLKLVDLTTVFPDKKMEKVTAINDVPLDYTAEDIINKDEEAVKTTIDSINKEADLANTGLESVKFEDKKLTVTVATDSLNTNLTQARDKVKEIIRKLISEQQQENKITGVASVSYNGTTIKLADLDETKINEFARKLLKDLSQSNKDPKDLTYEDIANRSANIQVTYIKDGLNLGTVDYEVSFVYDVQKIVEKNEQTLKTETEKLLSTPEGNETLKSAFSKVEYNDKTLTFEVKSGETDITSIRGTNLINVFLENFKDATKIEVTVDNTTETFEVPANTELTTDTVYTWIIKVLQDMSGKTILPEAVATINSSDDTITLNDLINKEATAKVTYDVNGQTATEIYTLKFTPDYTAVNNVIDSVKAQIPSIVNEAKTKIAGKGISDVSVNSTNDIVTFKINDGSKDASGLSGLGLTSIIKKMFEGATKVSYTIHNKRTIGPESKVIPSNSDEIRDKAIDGLKTSLQNKLLSSAYYNDEVHTSLKDFIDCTIDVTVTYNADGLEKDQHYQIKLVKDENNYTESEVA